MYRQIVNPVLFLQCAILLAPILKGLGTQNNTLCFHIEYLLDELQLLHTAKQCNEFLEYSNRKCSNCQLDNMNKNLIGTCLWVAHEECVTQCWDIKKSQRITISK